MKFHEMYPNVQVEIVEANTDDMMEMLNQNDVDLTFIVDRHVYSKDFVVISEKRVEMNFIAGIDYDLGNRDSFSIEELVKFPFVLTEKELSCRRIFEEKLAELSLEVNPVVEIGNTYLLLELIELGAGVSFLPDYVTSRAYNEGRIKYLNVRDFDVEVWRQLLYHKNKWISPAMKRVINYCSAVSENMR